MYNFCLFSLFFVQISMSVPKGDQDVIRFVRIQPVHSCVVVGMVIKCIRTDKLAEVQHLYTMTVIKYLVYFTY